MSENNMPLSQNLVQLDAKGFWITGALWDTGYGVSYEIGLRCKRSGQFFLLQGWDDSTSMNRAALLIKAGLDADLGLDCIKGAFR